jgi:hypothetical protein
MDNYNAEHIINLLTGVVGCSVFILSLAIAIAIILFLQGCYRAIPEAHRKMDPGLVWLLLIPLFNLVWMFFVFIRLAKSFGEAYAAQNRQVDTGEKMALAFCVCFVAGAIPFVGCIATPASLVLLVLVLLRFNQLKKELGQPPANPY